MRGTSVISHLKFGALNSRTPHFVPLLGDFNAINSARS